ncbi:MAG: lamin tail domain-containing protein, partial [Bacteroidaceae bacterium]|nr:lamin tail domain-containing protein [Bacteroidaceae bacterium]
ENSYISFDEEFQMPTTGNLSLTACYEPLTEEELAETYITPVKINEICASNSIYVNEYFEKNDWIELYNTTGEDFDVAGMYISDNIDKPLKYQIPTDGIVNTIIKPNGHMVIWADKLEPLSQLHTTFKLGAEGGEVILTSADQTWCDTLVYAAHNGDFSVGLYPDGGTNAYIMSKTTIGATNEINSYSVFWDEPFIPNAIEDIQITRNGTLGITFADNTINLHSEESGKANVYVYALAGQTVMEQNITLTGSTEHIGLHHLPNGTYVVKATDHNGNICTIKVLKQ